MKRSIQDCIKLSNGVLMPQHGFGVYLIKEEAEAEVAIGKALEVGYRSFDTAQFYQNEGLLASLLHRSSVPQNELFITTKITNEKQGYDQTLSSFEQSMKEMQLKQLDLLLVHWPSKTHFFETWRAFERLYEEKLVRAIGVCNFQIEHLEKLATRANVQPAVNQIECHPYLTQRPLLDYMNAHGIEGEAWSPLGRGAVLQDPVIAQIAQVHSKSAAQIILRWHVQRDLIVIPKSATPSRIAENAAIYDFALNDEEMASIDALNQDKRTGPDPDVVYEKI
ncbi:aldo/keto reductase [Brevibacillus fluminis]|uniref:Aldo/keto reductase n=1 Tax=Brevibacillus fluminis TaxID=511487 RepID=A0A3M8DPA1_9BACL|nr:aldo/keto reductase [Brevibacillus fluminis]RNB89928.1 aldo/keto reductase [Brevibacillus fluminis]